MSERYDLRGKETIEARFWRKVHKTDGCWLWLGRPNKKGYGYFTIGVVHRRVHRFAYELLIGPIPEGLTIDHLCRNKMCVNPAHLEPVTSKENSLRGFNPLAINARKTNCINGHEFTPENTMKSTTGGRACRACNRKYQREWSRVKRAKLAHKPLEVI